MNKNDYINIIKILKQKYPEATCSLNFNTPFEIVIAVMLSAQCTDERVNKVTPKLFSHFTTIESYAKADVREIEKYIHSCGFYKNKAKNVIATAQKILDDYNGVVPNEMDLLLTLPGIGRKSANVILLEAFGISKGIAIDTHCKRISNRLGLSNQKDPLKIEDDLIKKFPKEYYKDINHLFIYFGRDICSSRNPSCEVCPVKSYCKFYNKKQK